MADKYELESVKAFVETLQVSRLKVLGNHNNWSLGRLLPVCVMGGETIPYSTLIYFLCTLCSRQSLLVHHFSWRMPLRGLES